MIILQKLRSLLVSKAPSVSQAASSPVASSPTLPTIREMIDSARQSNSIDELIEHSGHYNGHVREAALRRAAQLNSPRMAPAIAARLNDWVPQIRELAQAVLLDMLPAIGAEETLRLLPAVQHLHHAGRADHAYWIAAFEQACVDKLGEQRIVDEVRNPDVRIARACFRLSQEGRLVLPESVIEHLLTASADIVLAKQAVVAIAGIPEHERTRLYQRALQSKFGMVRAIALRPLLSVATTENDALAARMLSDSQMWVRLIAASYLGKRGIDSTAILAGILKDKRANSLVIRACLAGIAELDGTAHLDLVRSFADDSTPRVQAAAYLAWLQLAPSSKDEIAASVLHSPSRRVRKLALQLVRKYDVYLAPEVALPLMAAHDDVDMMLEFVKGQLWERLGLIIQLEPRSRQDLALRTRLTHELLEWIDTSGATYVRPNDAQRDLFRKEETRQQLHALLPPRDLTRSLSLDRELQQIT